MHDWKSYIKGKKVTVMGLGLLGRGLGDIKFLAEEGAELIVTDLKTKEQLAPSLDALKDFPQITYVLGEHRLEDFKERDFVLKAAGVPLDSPYISEARKNNIPIEMSTALFARFTEAMLIGITGTRGKSTVTHLTHHILNQAKDHLSGRVFIGGNVRGVSTLPLLKEAKAGDIVILELDSWQLQGFGEHKLSPHIAVFTTFMKDHLNYYMGDMQAYFNDKAHIFAHQKAGDYFIYGEELLEKIKAYTTEHNLKLEHMMAPPEPFPQDWQLALPGEHNKHNAAFAISIARTLNIPELEIKAAVESFKSLPGRLELRKEIKGIKIYNDNNATTPDATIAALQAFPKNKNIVLVMGGTDKNIPMDGLINAIDERCKSCVFYQETGTDKIKEKLFGLKDVNVIETETFEESVKKGLALCRPGDILLFSPAFASFGRFFKNEFERMDQFNAIVDSF